VIVDEEVHKGGPHLEGENMNTVPDLSVIVPVYNEEKYVRQCVQSIREQTKSNIEIILVDDGSFDSSPEICDELKKEDGRIKTIHQENRGMINARFTGVKMATGNYVTFCDADDFISRDAYRKQIDIAKKFDADIVTSGIYRHYGIDRNVKDIGSVVAEGLYKQKEIREYIIPNMLWDERSSTWGIDPSLCIKIFKREFIEQQYENVFHYSFSFGEDSVVIYPLILQSRRIYVTHNCYYYHRQRENNSVAPYIENPNFPNEVLKLYSFLRECFLNDISGDVLIKQLDMFYIRAVNYLKQRYPDLQKKNVPSKTKVWLFPFGQIEKGSRIVLYGAGKVGRQLREQLSTSGYCEEVIWVDKNPPTDCVGVMHPESIDYDDDVYLVIAIEDKDICDDIKNDFMRKGWDNSRIIISNFREQCFYV